MVAWGERHPGIKMTGSPLPLGAWFNLGPLVRSSGTGAGGGAAAAAAAAAGESALWDVALGGLASGGYRLRLAAVDVRTGLPDGAFAAASPLTAAWAVDLSKPETFVLTRPVSTAQVD